MMETDYIKRLIEAFYNGETTAMEEKELKDYFTSEDVAEELLQDKIVFLEMQNEDTIDVPVGLEAKLSSLIDELAEKEKINTKTNKRSLLPWIGSAAACIALFISIGLYFNQKPQENKILSTLHTTTSVQPFNTLPDSDETYKEAEKALTLLAVNFNKGVGQLEVVSSNLDKANEILNKAFNNKKNKES